MEKKFEFILSEEVKEENDMIDDVVFEAVLREDLKNVYTITWDDSGESNMYDARDVMNYINWGDWIVVKLIVNNNIKWGK